MKIYLAGKAGGGFAEREIELRRYFKRRLFSLATLIPRDQLYAFLSYDKLFCRKAKRRKRNADNNQEI
jgi:hypothetical protein